MQQLFALLGYARFPSSSLSETFASFVFCFNPYLFPLCVFSPALCSIITINSLCCCVLVPGTPDLHVLCPRICDSLKLLVFLYYFTFRDPGMSTSLEYGISTVRTLGSLTKLGKEKYCM